MRPPEDDLPSMCSDVDILGLVASLPHPTSVQKFSDHSSMICVSAIIAFYRSSLDEEHFSTTLSKNICNVAPSESAFLLLEVVYIAWEGAKPPQEALNTLHDLHEVQ